MPKSANIFTKQITLKVVSVFEKNKETIIIASKGFW